MSRANRWSIGAVGFVIVMAILGALVERATHRVVARIDGQFGYTPDPEGTRQFLATLGDEKFFSQAGAEAMKEAKGVDVFLYRQLDAAHRARYGKPFVVGRQQIGDCVSWGAAHAVAISEAVSFSLGKLPEPPLMPATEALYGGARVEARGKPGDGAQPYGGFSDGATGFGAAKFLREFSSDLEIMCLPCSCSHTLFILLPKRAPEPAARTIDAILGWVDMITSGQVRR